MKDVGFRRFLIEGAVPFGDALPTFIKGYCDSYRDLLEQNSAKGFSFASGSARKVNEHFFRYVSDLSNHVDPHFASGPQGSFRVLGNEAPDRASRFSLTFDRLARRANSVTQSLKKFRRNANKDSAEGPLWIYSPLYFARILLSSPAFPASDAIAHAAIRAFLFEEAIKFEDRWSSDLAWTSRQELLSKAKRESVVDVDEVVNNAFLRIREIIRFDRIENTLQKLDNFGKNRDSLPIKNATDFIVSHLLASRGMLLIRFDQIGSHSKSDDIKPSVSFSSFMSQYTLVPDDGVYEFDKPREVRQIPSASRLINELDGLPLAIPGADLVFQGGLRFTTSTGLVARLYGPAGIGKTSVALAIAASLAPIGTQTIYLSCEEKSDDLLHRIRTLVPLFIKRTQSYRPPEDWFTAEYVSGDDEQKRSQISNFLSETLTKYAGRLPSPENCPPGLMPLLIVLDGVHEMFPTGEKTDSALELRKLVEQCQATGALVLALSAESPRADLAEFDYLVDLVAHLDYAPMRGEMEPPTRLFKLEKSRRQLSRSGDHLLDLSGREPGITIIPQINAHLSENRTWNWVDPSPNLTVDFLLSRASFIPTDLERSDQPLVRIKDRSQILVMGRGSSGKSLFGLRILASAFVGDIRLREHQDNARKRDQALRLDLEGPRTRTNYTADEDWPWFEDPDPSHRRILILSFLYQKSFYDELKRSQKYWEEDSLLRNMRLKLTLDTEHFSPGFLRPEALINIVNEKIESAILDGSPYHGVLIDGIHNVFLQFPHLESSEIVWPALFELLRTRGLAVVTTHTHFDVSEYGSVMHDLQASRRRVAPLLHALVQSSDYTIKIHPIASLRYDEGDFARAAKDALSLGSMAPNLPQNQTRRPAEPARFLIEVPNSLFPGNILPPLDWGWDKAKGIAYQPHFAGVRNVAAQRKPS